jgi:putative ABC transport system permease protein
MSQILFRVSPRDPLTLTVVTVTLATAGLLACWLPARRAAALDPVKALRYE